MVMKILKKVREVQNNSIRREYTFTKKWVTRLLWFGVIWISLSYVLAFMGKPLIAEELSRQVADVVIATILGYLCKSYFETHSEKNLEYKKKINELNTERNERNENY